MGNDYSLFSSRLLAWYVQHRRDLPWRTKSGLPPAYHVLVSELMLQQTQVVTVIPYFLRFIDQFPTLQSLSKAPLEKVLRLWQGLGYYSRARNLHALAQRVVKKRDGILPCAVDELLELPGIGRYTAGAISSLAFDRRAPIVDGNVARVLCRVDCIREDPKSPETIKRLWQRSQEILPHKRIGDFNSAMMELGATVCTPRNPCCDQCPVREFCRSRKENLQEKIPQPRKSKPVPLIERTTCCIRHGNQWLIERRPEKGRWAGMWQFVTIPSTHELPKIKGLKEVGTIKHTLSHRKYRFKVVVCEPVRFKDERPRKWVTLAQIKQYPLPKPHVKIAEMLRSEFSL